MLQRPTPICANSLWKDIGESAIKKAVSTFVEEGVKAVVELWKERHKKEMDIEFKEREKARKEEAADADNDNGDNGDDDSEAEATSFEW